jgi:RHS repeat-associated protein
VALSPSFGPGSRPEGQSKSLMMGEFTGKERDSESGLDYFGARYYGSALGRFTSPDPSLDADRIVGTPQRWNRYAYVINNPFSRVDPDGAADVTVYYLRDTFT